MNSAEGSQASTSRAFQSGTTTIEPGPSTVTPGALGRHSVTLSSVTDSSTSSSIDSRNAQAGNKLEVRLSRIIGGVGNGLFTRKISDFPESMAFAKDDSIMDFTGTLSLRTRLRNKHFLSWMVSRHYCHPINDDSRIIWSHSFDSYGKGVEYPRCIAVYSNDSANFDEREFENPLEFNIDRESNNHMAFGHGIHFCLGGKPGPLGNTYFL